MLNLEKKRYGMRGLAPIYGLSKNDDRIVNADEIDVIWKEFCKFIGRYIDPDQKRRSYSVEWLVMWSALYLQIIPNPSFHFVTSSKFSILHRPFRCDQALC